MKLWTGRLAGETDVRAEDFGSSISFDARMAQQDIQGSIAHATMLGETGIITAQESRTIVEGLKNIAADLQSGALAIDADAEDIHTFVELELTKRLGDVGKKLHTARSRNDQVALDIRLTLREEIDEISSALRSFCDALLSVAQSHVDTVMPGYTHIQRAQPVTLGHHLLAYAHMTLRDLDRLRGCKRRMDSMPLGSGALAGTTFPIDRQRTAALLGFSRVSQNSLDGVSDRDFIIELLADLSLVMVHLSRLCEEIVLWSSWEFRFINLSDAFTTGSSIMPQKKNPDVAELIRGKSGRVFGDLMTLLAVMKSLPLAYNADMQEDKEAVFDAVDTVKASLSTLTGAIETMTVHRERMAQAVQTGFLNATDCADYLVKKGLAFRDAYRIAGELVTYCLQHGETLESLSLEAYQTHSDAFEQDVYEAIDVMHCLSKRNVEGGPAPESVQKQIEWVRKELAHT